MADIADVARYAGVSISTVSRALNGKSASDHTRKKVIAAAAELGYVVSSSAASLARGRMNTIGYMVPFFDRWYFTSILKGIEAELLEHGFDLTLYDLQGVDQQRERIFATSLRRASVDGLIAASIELAPHEIQTLQDLGKPVVSIGGTIEGVSTIDLDNLAIARHATEHLISLGHTRIGHIGNGNTLGSAFHLGDTRYQGWESAFQTAGLTADPALYRESDFDIASGYAAAKSLLAINQPTAIFAACDEIAIGAVLAARDLGFRVPRDLSIIGIDDHELAEFFGLTTIAQTPDQQGRLAAGMLLDLLNRPNTSAQHLRHQTSLVLRSSTARPTVGP
ncbi:LacI family DNA-binding transcriptional regulator [Cryobacterium sp. TMT4-31]|uniref:LacI family DNA-binding transcriptional regulator n=1 Tax=Cryobacterium sp. TMT4-31 TaxID=1259259 RepID=UPI00106CA64B|nr:LacI family DNA-binding transcriptional regulator [Cryobacterium sp. TMT4-31]TFC93076.1 LacI family transcriptional regulator [Cryobacterium sp. TMT4-31]